MKTKDLLLQISHVETLLKKFSFEELDSNEASLVQKSFVSFKESLLVQLANKGNELMPSRKFSRSPESFVDNQSNAADPSTSTLTPDIYNAIIAHFDAYVSLLESLNIDPK